MSEFSITAVLISALISAVVGVVAWGRRPAPGWLGLTILGCSACAWSFSYSLPWLFVTKTLPHVWVLLASVPVFIYQAAVLLLVLEYTRREELNLRRSLLILAIEPAIMLVVVALDPVFGLYVGAHGQGSLLGPVSRGGPAFWAHSVYVLALTAVAITLMGQSLRDPRWLARRQAWTILGAVLLNFLAYVVQLAGLSPLPSLNLVPFTFAVTGLMLVYGLFSLGLLSIIPVARTRLVEEMREGVLVLDEEGTIIDANPAAIRLAGLPAHAIGLSAREVLRATGTNLKKLRDREPVELSVRTDSLRVLEASTSYVVSKAGDTRAQLITLRDVTQQKQLEYNLEAGRRQLEGELELVGRMLDAMSEGVLLMDAAGALVMGNPAAGRILGVQLGDRQGEPVADTIPAFPATALAELAWRDGVSLTEEVEVADGLWLTVEAIPLEVGRPADRQTLFVVQDETARHAVEATRRDFVANVSHELKTPLAGLLLLTQTLQHVLRERPEDAEEFAARMASEIRRLTKLTEDLLSLAQLEDPEWLVRAPLAETDLSRLGEEVVEEVRPRAAAKDQELLVDTQPKVPLLGDEIMLRLLIRNLLDNAVRYTGAGGHISLHTGRETDADGRVWAVLTVADDGEGMAPEDQARVFERFYRVDRARTRGTGGTGIGLAIVRHAAERHGGSVEVESELGKGSRFTVRLPGE